MLKAYRDRYISRLNKIYENGLNSANVCHVEGWATFVDKNTIQVGGTTLTADHILIATGGAPNKLGIPGEELAIDSDKFFELEMQPKKVAVIGAGYIAVELAGVFNGLGTDTSLFLRGNGLLKTFDPMIRSNLETAMKKAGWYLFSSFKKNMNAVIHSFLSLSLSHSFSGVQINSGTAFQAITKESDGTLTIHLKDGRVSGCCDCHREPTY